MRDDDEAHDRAACPADRAPSPRRERPTRRGLVQDQDTRLSGKGSGDGHARRGRPTAWRRRVRTTVEPVRPLHRAQRRAGIQRRPSSASSSNLSRKNRMLSASVPVSSSRSRRPRRGPGASCRGRSAQLLPSIRTRPSRRRAKTQHHRGQRRLPAPRARRPRQLPLLELEAHSAQRVPGRANMAIVHVLQGDRRSRRAILVPGGRRGPAGSADSIRPRWTRAPAWPCRYREKLRLAEGCISSSTVAPSPDSATSVVDWTTASARMMSATVTS